MQVNDKAKVDAKTHRRWLQTWMSIEGELANLPAWAQETLCDDINTAVQSRIVVMSGAQKQF